MFCGPAGHNARVSCLRHSAGVFRPCVPAWVSPSRSRFVPLRSPRPTGRAVRRDPVSRVSRAGGRPLAPARFARLIAPARASPGAGHTSPVGFSGIFSRRRRRKRRSGLRITAPSGSIWLWLARSQADLGNFINIFEQKAFQTPQPGEANLFIDPVNRRTCSSARQFQLVTRLQIQPERGRDAERMFQPKRRVGGDATAPAQDVADPVPGGARRLSEPDGAQPMRLHEVFAERYPG